MRTLEQELSQELSDLRAQRLYRKLRPFDSAQGIRIRSGERSWLNFSSNDYLGLAGHPRLREAAARAADQYGAGAGASRLISGSLALFHELEERLAVFKGTEACLIFSSGYAAAMGAIGALVGREDIIVLDKRVHASIVDAARLSGAKLRVFSHNDINDLERILQWATTRDRKERLGSGRCPRILVVTESVFSMDGDAAPLREIVDLKNRYGAWLMLDEAHATGICGARGRGWAEHAGLADQVEVQMGTLGKALGAAGGYLCGTRVLIDFFVNRARSFIFSTAPVPASAGAALEGVKLLETDEVRARRDRLWKNVGLLVKLLDSTGDSGWRMVTQPRTERTLHRAVWPSAIVPLILGSEDRALRIADAMQDRGFFVPAVRYPSVARGAARLRITLCSEHTPAEIEQFVTDLRNSIDEPLGEAGS